MSLLDQALSRLDTTTVIVFLLVFLIGYYWLTTPRNLPPGPLGLPVVGNLLTLAASSDMLGQLRKWRKQYGDIFTLRLGNRYAIVVSSYELMHETFVKQSDVFSGRPTTLHILSKVIAKTGSGVILGYGPKWKELRRVTLMALRDFGMGKKSLQQRVQDEARAVMGVIDKSQGHPIALKPLLSKFSANVICSVIFGNRFDYDDPKFIELTVLVNQILSQPTFLLPVNFMPALRLLPHFGKTVSGIVEPFATMDEFLGKLLKEHEKTYDPSEVRDFVDICIKTRSESEDAHLYDAANMRRVMLDLFNAGTETSSTTLDWLILYMVAFPEVQTRCQQDLDKVVGQDRLVTMEDRKDLPYIDAVITEILRVVTIAPLALPHMAVKETDVRGYTVPADTIVLANISGMHHDPAVWPDPYLFNPGRFLDKGGHFCPPKENFVPFSLGPRVCLGEVLARMEVFILFSTLVQFFTFTMGQGQTPDLEGQLGVTFSAKGQQVIAKRR